MELWVVCPHHTQIISDGSALCSLVKSKIIMRLRLLNVLGMREYLLLNFTVDVELLLLVPCAITHHICSRS